MKHQQPLVAAAIGFVVGLVLAIPAVLSSGGGHGDYGWAVFFFPFLIFTVPLLGSFFPIILFLAGLKYGVFGLMVGLAIRRPIFRTMTVLFILLHLSGILMHQSPGG